MVNDSFVRLIQVAKEDATIRESLLTILNLNPKAKSPTLEALISKISSEGAPIELVEAVSTLRNPNVAAKALEILAQV